MCVCVCILLLAMSVTSVTAIAQEMMQSSWCESVCPICNIFHCLSIVCNLLQIYLCTRCGAYFPLLAFPSSALWRGIVRGSQSAAVAETVSVKCRQSSKDPQRVSKERMQNRQRDSHFCQPPLLTTACSNLPVTCGTRHLQTMLQAPCWSHRRLILNCLLAAATVQNGIVIGTRLIDT